MQLPWSLVRPSERKLTLTLSVLHFFLIALFTFSKIARDALFLEELPASYLPYMYMALAVLSVGTVAMLARFKKASASRILYVYNLVVAASLIAFIPWFLASPQTAAIAFYIWCGIFGVGLVTEFWLLANEAIDTRAARRLLGVIGASGIAGGLVAGFAATAVGVTLGPLVLLFMSAVLAVAVAFVANRTGSVVVDTEVQESVELAHKPTAVTPLKSGYVRLLVLLFFFSGITLAVVDYAFKIFLQNELTEGGKITSALGIFYSVQNLIALVAQLGLAGVLLTRFGGRPISNALPVGILAAISLTLIAPVGVASLVFVSAPLYAAIMRVSLTRSAWQFLYFPLPGTVRRKVKRFIDIVVNRGADAVAGATLLALTFLAGGEFMDVIWLAGVLCALWVAVELKMNRAYPNEVKRALERQDTEISRPQIKLSDLSGPEDLRILLRSGDSSDVLYGIDMIELLQPDMLREVKDKLLNHPVIEVRARILASLHGLGDDIAGFADTVHSSDLEITDDINVEAGVLDNPAERVIQAVSSNSGNESTALLAQLIDDPNRDVRRVAYRLAAASGSATLLSELIRRLASRQDPGVIRGALTDRLSQDPDPIIAAFDNPQLSVSERCSLIAVLRTSDHPIVIRALYRASQSNAHRQVASAALSALKSIRQTKPTVTIPEEDVVGDLKEDISRFGMRLVQLVALAEAPDPELKALVEKALRERSWQSLERAFTRMSLVYDIERAELAFRSVRGSDKHVASQAIEYLDTHLPRQLKDLIIPILDTPSEEERAKKFANLSGSKVSTPTAAAEELLISRDPILRACALYVIGRLNRADYLGKVRDAGNDPDPIVRDTAIWALRRLTAGAKP